MTTEDDDFPMKKELDRAFPVHDSDLYGELRQRVEGVVLRLPREVCQDLLGDPHVVISLDRFEPGKGRTVFGPDPRG